MGEPFDLEIKVDTGMGRMGVLEDGFEAPEAAATEHGGGGTRGRA